jgi:predicted Na+-dependent transporter
MLERLTRVPTDTFLLALLAVVAAATVFPATGTGAVGLIMLPLILFQKIQLFVCAVIASRMSRTVPVD